MLTIGKLGTTRGRLEYYDAQVAAGVEDYYAGRGESPGRWRGAGAKSMGLTERGPVKRHEFMALMRGRHPVDGTVLRTMAARSTVSGFDLTFSAPKSVSVLFAIGGEHTSAELLAAHEHAVEVTLAYLEREACFTRRGRDGVDRLRGDGFIAAAYRHRMSRAGDPQLHTHVVVANMTRAEGRHTAVDARAIYEHKSAGGAVYRAVLRREVRERFPWAAWHRSGRGLFELDGVPEPVLRHFSQRRAQIDERAFELAGVGASELSRARTQAIALATRRAKTDGIDGAGWREQARARAAEHGLGAGELAALTRRRAGDAPQPDLVAATCRLSGPEGLTERHNTFARRHALAELAGVFSQGATREQLEHGTSDYLEDESVARLAPGSGGEPRYSTQDLLALERDIVDGAARRQNERTGVLPAALVEATLRQHEPGLNADQATAVRFITGSGRGVEAVTALAGTGKTTIIGALARAYRRAGWQVIGAAPTARAARQLRELAGIPADTMHAQLARLQRHGGLDSRTVLVLDEAGMAPTRRSAALLAMAESAGAKVIAIGDPGQLAAVEAGGWLAALARRQDGPGLREVMRQRDVGEQQALESLHDGDPEPYLTFKRDAITLHETEIAALLEVRDGWHAAQRRHGCRNAVMIARENLTRERLNRAARALLKRDRVLEQTGLYIGGREYSPGDRVLARRNDRGRDIDNGSLGTILAVDEDRFALWVQIDSGELRTLEHDYVAEHLEHAYALTAHAAQGATLTWAAVVGRPSDFSREWAYTALSRAREETVVHVISEPPERIRAREEYAPADPTPERDETLQALSRAMRRSEAEALALEHGVLAGAPETPGASSSPESDAVVPRLAGLKALQARVRGPQRSSTLRL